MDEKFKLPVLTEEQFENLWNRLHSYKWFNDMIDDIMPKPSTDFDPNNRLVGFRTDKKGGRRKIEGSSRADYTGKFLSGLSSKEALIKSLFAFILEFLCNARNEATRIASYLRSLMTKQCMKILIKANSMN